ncbi:unnamed protein product, partial [Sphenostylis stenocarpa]
SLWSIHVIRFLRSRVMKRTTNSINGCCPSDIAWQILTVDRLMALKNLGNRTAKG